jgi:hypothetical protein
LLIVLVVANAVITATSIVEISNTSTPCCLKMSKTVIKAMDRLYPGMGHTVNQDEIESVREMVEAI